VRGPQALELFTLERGEDRHHRAIQLSVHHFPHLKSSLKHPGKRWQLVPGPHQLLELALHQVEYILAHQGSFSGGCTHDLAARIVEPTNLELGAQHFEMPRSPARGVVTG